MQALCIMIMVPQKLDFKKLNNWRKVLGDVPGAAVRDEKGTWVNGRGQEQAPRSKGRTR